MKKSKLNFYLNPHDEYKWTKCPKCDNGTKLRKFCLMIHYGEKSIDFHQLISLNKACKFCPKCELLIAQKSEIEHHLHEVIQTFLDRHRVKIIVFDINKPLIHTWKK